MDSRKIENAVWQANILLHEKEGPYYQAIHFEIFNFLEQHRLTRALIDATSKVSSRSRVALDFGCGTGNVTSKLLSLGWKVIAADTSKTMLAVLKNNLRSACSTGQLLLYQLEGKRLNLKDESLGIITCYSVLHHLYDYMYTIDEFSRVLDKGGVLFIDHEQSDDFWKSQGNLLYELDVKTSLMINDLYLRRVRRIKSPSLDYTLSDYRTRYGTRISWPDVRTLLREKGFIVREQNYLVHRCVLPNLLHLACRTRIKDTRELTALKQTTGVPANPSSGS